MKSINSLFLFAILLVFTIFGCGPSLSPTTTPVTPAPTLTPTLLPKGKTIIVTSTADSGLGTLRQALLDAQTSDTIVFDLAVFPPDSPVTISLSTGLPELSQGNLTIDASNAGVILDGSSIDRSNPQHGLSIPSNGNIIRGLQITGFSDAGIGLYGGAQNNVIGGDRGSGNSPLGQGNLISGNANFGIGLWDPGTSHNTIQGNYIGITLDGIATWGHPRDGIHSNGATENLITGNVIGGNNESGVYLCCVADGKNVVTANIIGVDPDGTIPLGNHQAGITIDRTAYNVIGPGNIIASNDGQGILFWEETAYNTITQNSIHDNGGQGIDQTSSFVASVAPPIIFEFDLDAGVLAGWGCGSCSVEIFSDNGDEGALFEGQIISDANGVFTFGKGGAFTGPGLTATVTDIEGNTSEFSIPTSGQSKSITLQEDNQLLKVGLETKPPAELADNRTGASFGAPWHDFDSVVRTVTNLGLKRIDTSYGENEPPIDWDVPEDEISPLFDQFINDLGENGVAINYLLHFWDKAGHPEGQGLSTPRFKTEEQIQDFLDYVRFVVRHFKGRIQYYTIWSEPDNCNPPPIKCIRPNDYINLARQTIPVILQEDPQAKVVLAPNVVYFDRDYLFTILSSDVISMFDVISWHGIYDVAPNAVFYGNYYYEYPSLIQEIKQTASGSGFQGEYWATELTWCSEEFPGCHPADQPWGIQKTDLLAAKYYARGIVMHLGMDVGVGLGGFQNSAPWSFPTMSNVNNIMAGSTSVKLAVEIETEATNFMSYGFSLPNGDKLFALWTNGVAVDDDPGVSSTLTFSGLSAQSVTAIDVLHGFEQELIIETENGNLVIRNLLVKDYPIILRLIR